MIYLFFFSHYFSLEEKEMSENIESLLSKAMAFYDNNEHQKAENLYSEILKREPKQFEALKFRGDCYRMLAKYSEGFLDLDEANRIKPNDEWILRTLGATQIQLGKLENAIPNLIQALRLSPYTSFTLGQLGNAYLLLGEFQKSLNYFNESDKWDPKNWYTKWKRGIVYRKLGKIKESWNDLKEAVDLSPQTDPLKVDFIASSRLMKSSEMALFYLSGIPAIQRSFLEAQVNVELGKLEEAERILKEVEPRVKHFVDQKEFQNVQTALKKRKEQPLKPEILDPTNVFEQISEMIGNSEPTKLLEQISAKIESTQSDFRKIHETLNNCKNLYTAESGVGLVSELKKNVVELNNEIEKQAIKIKELEKENKEYEQRLQCMICMEKPRETVVLPCLHFLFCETCMFEHKKSSNKCPSCNQTTTGSLHCRLEGESVLKNTPNKKRKEHPTSDLPSTTDDESEDKEKGVEKEKEEKNEGNAKKKRKIKTPKKK